MAETAHPPSILRDRLRDFLATQLAQKGEQECIGIEFAFVAPGDPEQVLRRWDRVNPQISDQEALPEIVVSILIVAEEDAARRADGRHQYVVRARNRNGLSTVFRFGARGGASNETPAVPYNHATVRRLVIGNPIEIEITTSRLLHPEHPGEHSTVFAINIKNPVDIEVVSSVESSHLPAPPKHQSVALDAIVTSLQPFIAQVFRQMDQARKQPKSPEPEN